MCGATKLRQRRPLPIADVLAYVALLAWSATFVGLIRSLVSSLIPALHSANGRRATGLLKEVARLDASQDAINIGRRLPIEVGHVDAM